MYTYIHIYIYTYIHTYIYNYIHILHTGSFLNYTTNSSIGSASISCSLLRESQRKQERRKISSKAEKILDAPSLMNDYCM